MRRRRQSDDVMRRNVGKGWQRNCGAFETDSVATAMKTLQKRKLKTENRVRMEKVFYCEACNARKKVPRTLLRLH